MRRSSSPRTAALTGAEEGVGESLEGSPALTIEQGPEAALLPRMATAEVVSATPEATSSAGSRWRNRMFLITSTVTMLALAMTALTLTLTPVGPHWSASVHALIQQFSWPWAELFLGKNVNAKGWVERPMPSSQFEPLPYPSLMCFLITRTNLDDADDATPSEIMNANQEFALVKAQYKHRAGVFACDHYVVYSDKEVALNADDDKPFVTQRLTVSLRSKAGKIEHILNAYIFMEAWHQVLHDKEFMHYDYIIKADPDAVFFASRLRTHLKQEFPHPEPGEHSIYLVNCKFGFGFYGALEVISRQAAQAYYEGYPRCTSALPWKEYGEDLFMKKCLDMLDVRAVDDLHLVSDAYCGDPPGECLSGQVAYHPLKNKEVFFHCHNMALGLPLR